jgi:hypothetical protein
MNWTVLIGFQINLHRREVKMDEPEEIFGGAKQRAFGRPSQLARTVPKLDNCR